MSIFERQIEVPRSFPLFLLMLGVGGPLFINFSGFGLITVSDGTLLSVEHVKCDWYCDDTSIIKTTTGTYTLSGTVQDDVGAKTWTKSSGDRLAGICVGFESACYDVKK